MVIPSSLSMNPASKGSFEGTHSDDVVTGQILLHMFRIAPNGLLKLSITGEDQWLAPIFQGPFFENVILKLTVQS